MKRSLLAKIGLALLALFVLLQLVPYGRGHDNPPVSGEPPWDAPRTRALFMRACGDCHSHSTEWPWYSHVAPVSWLVAHDVEEAREHFNVSTWDRGPGDADEAAHEYEEGEMPLWFYVPLHPEAKLAAEERDQLLAGLRATFGGER
jgi:hypothetical protein